jgi:hypothetical protein
VVTGQAERDPERELRPERVELAELIVDASADEHEFVTDPPIASFRFVKHPDRSGVDPEENE